MNSISIFCKSYRKDVDLTRKLLDSIFKYNKDKIPVTISCPLEDINLFKDKLGSGYQLINDELLFSEKTGNGWIDQQVVKANSWLLNKSVNYLIIDSDSIFIRDFFISDFIFDKQNNIPYTICHEQKDLFNWTAINNNLGFDPKISFIEDRKKIMTVFGMEETNVFLDFGPSPIIWNEFVWKSFYEKFLKINNTTIDKILKMVPSEFTWYGIWLLYSQAIRIIPREPLFKVFHYQQQYQDFLKNINLNKDENDILSKNYLGIVKQSNWR